jgi:UDP-glucose 4-epimerase
LQRKSWFQPGCSRRQAIENRRISAQTLFLRWMKKVHDISKKRVLVTGASGFIGFHLCKRLRDLGCEVHGVSRAHRSRDERVSEWWQCDLSQPSEVVEIVKSIRADIVFHLSSLVTGSRSLEMVLPTFQANLAGTVNLLTALSGVRCGRVLLIGSMEEPHWDKPLPSSISPYAASKWSCGIYGRLFHSLYDLPVVMLHLFMVYGPGQLDVTKVIPYVTLSLLRNEIPMLTSGSRKVDWIYIDDVVDALIACAQVEGLEGETVEAGSGELITVREVVEKIAFIINSQAEPRFGVLEDRAFENVRVADVERTFGLIGWKAGMPINEGLRRTIGWYKEQMVGGAF